MNEFSATSPPPPSPLAAVSAVSQTLFPSEAAGGPCLHGTTGPTPSLAGMAGELITFYCLGFPHISPT